MGVEDVDPANGGTYVDPTRGLAGAHASPIRHRLSIGLRTLLDAKLGTSDCTIELRLPNMAPPILSRTANACQHLACLAAEVLACLGSSTIGCVAWGSSPKRQETHLYNIDGRLLVQFKHADQPAYGVGTSPSRWAALLSKAPPSRTGTLCCWTRRRS